MYVCVCMRACVRACVRGCVGVCVRLFHCVAAARDKDSADGDSDGNGSHVPIDGSQQALYDEQVCRDSF